MLNKIKSFYISERINKIDSDFLSYEEDFIKKDDISTILSLLTSNSKVKLKNTHNSIILYCTGLSDDFDFEKARSDTIDGSPPDIDIDFDALNRQRAIDWVIEKWGRDNVANIITHGTFKPKSLARGYYRVTEKNSEHLNEILREIPQPKFGKEATMEEILAAAPKIKTEEKYSDFLEFSDRLENMVSTFGIHAAGVVISDFPIHDVVPMWKNSKAERITQFDKDETEQLGLIKFDFLGIDTLSIIQESVNLIKQTTGEDIDPFKIADHNEKTYTLMQSGLLTGIFQMETSGKAKQLIQEIHPKSISELSDISALNRPGPMQAGLDKNYISTKKQGFTSLEMPESVKEILKDTQYTLIYQEQIMALLNKMAGFSLKEADDARRAMGKKKKEVLEAYKEKFISGSLENGIESFYSESLWEDIMGFADYCLHEDVKILTKEYGLKKISEIVNDKLDCTIYSMYNDRVVEQKVKQYWEKSPKECFKYTFEDSSFVVCTSDHKFMSSDNSMIDIDSIFYKEIELKENKCRL